jgi:hypothetical protein
MGGHDWQYFVPYQADIGKALQELRQREFLAGRYNPVQRYLTTPNTADSPAPGPGHASIEAAVKASGSEGTRSILDMNMVGQKPKDGVVTVIPAKRLVELFGTAEPTREMIEGSDEFFDDIERGQGVYIVAYDRGAPSELCFAGYSYD